MILNPGQIIAFRYEIIEEIGSGGMSIVYRARDTKLFRDVSLKVMRPEHMESEEFIDRFHTEARAIASLNHANIVNVYDVGNEDGINFIVMEYVDGSTLKELINKKAPFNDISMLGVANQIAIALAHAHEAGIVHRDIKPQNILVMNTGVVKVTDFGIAVSARANARRNSEDDHGTTMGSVHYISPEQACNDPVDPRSDLYSLGIVMYEMMTGDLPFDGESAEDIAAMHIETKLPDLRQFNPETDEAVIRLIKTLTNKLPERRYQTAAEAAAIMQMAMTNSANTPDAPEAEPIAEAPPAPPIRRRPPRPIMRPDDGRQKLKERLVIAIAVLLAIGIMGAVVWVVAPWFQSNGDGEPRIVQIPDIVGLPFDDAENTLRDEYLVINMLREEYNEEHPAGYIIWMNFNPGGNVFIGTVIDVTVSLGTGLVAVPDIVALEIGYAEGMLANLPFYIEETGFAYHGTIPLNHILSQTPAHGTMVARGTTIRVVVSGGAEIVQIPVPNLVGMAEDGAIARLMELGLSVGVIHEMHHADVAAGIVLNQNMNTGRMVPDGTAIGFTVSMGPAPTPDPTEPPDDPNGPDPDENGDPDTPGNGENGEPFIPEPDEPENGDEPVIPPLGSYPLFLSPSPPAGLTRFELELARVMPTGDLQSEFIAIVYVHELPLVVDVEGSGNVEFVVFINGSPVGSQVVNFDE